jgi:hypothetical protein
MSWGSRNGKNIMHLFSDREFLLLSKIIDNGYLLTNECHDLVGGSFGAIKCEVNKKLRLRQEPTILKEFVEKDFYGRRVYRYFVKQ